MKIKLPLLLLTVLITIFSCEKEEDKITENPITKDPTEDTVVEDETKPVLTVSGLTDVIETNTLITISIVDDSAVETKVMRNDEEIASSSDKQFEVTINPYLISVGATDFTFVSTDAKGNEITETFNIEIKHLLMIYGHSAQADANSNFDSWLFFNDLEGNELAVVDPSVGDNKIYTDEIILDDNILYTIANYNLWEPFVGSIYKNLFVDTYRIPLGGIRPQITYDEYVEPANTVEVKLNDIPFVNYSPDYYAHGYRYSTGSYSGDELQTTLQIKHDTDVPICIRTNRWGGSSPKFDGKKENYRHIFITPEPGQTTMEIAGIQLIPAENNLTLNIPVHEPGSLFVDRKAYINSEDFMTNRYTSIYDKDSSNEIEVADYIDLPLNSMFGYYYSSISYLRNGAYYSTNGPDSDLDLNMPDWTMNVQFTDTTMELVANNPDVDYYSIRLNKNEYDTNNSKSLNWNYNIFGEDDSDKIIPRLVLPEMISDGIGDSYFENIIDLELYHLSAVDYAKYDSYDQVIDWFIFNKNVPVGGENKNKQLSITYNNSGKSTAKDRPWDLDALHRYGLDTKGQVKNRR